MMHIRLLSTISLNYFLEQYKKIKLGRHLFQPRLNNYKKGDYNMKNILDSVQFRITLYVWYYLLQVLY